MELPATEFYGEPLKEEVEAGRLPVDVVDTAVRRVLRMKLQLGLFEQPYVDAAAAAAHFQTREQRALARRAAAERLDGCIAKPVSASALLDAIGSRLVGPDGVVPGYSDGGDGGLFNGILARYLADAALRRPALAAAARRIVLASAAAAWQGRVELPGGPVFAQDWRRPARPPRPGLAEADLSVQLSGWMLLEAAAVLAGDDPS
jgi:hypothetical protein